MSGHTALLLQVAVACDWHIARIYLFHVDAEKQTQEFRISLGVSDTVLITVEDRHCGVQVAVLVLNVTHINVWYDQHPGAIRDPQVPPSLHTPPCCAVESYTVLSRLCWWSTVLSAMLHPPDRSSQWHLHFLAMLMTIFMFMFTSSSDFMFILMFILMSARLSAGCISEIPAVRHASGAETNAVAI